MSLKLRQIGLGSGIDKDRQDYTGYTGGWDIGRIYEPDSLRWFWSLTVNGPMTRSDRWRPWKRLRRSFRKLERVEGVGEAGRDA